MTETNGKIKFDSPEEMLETIQSGTDLYNSENELYVFGYNDAGSICVYDNIDEEQAAELKTKEEYWGAYLGWRGSAIYDDPSHECNTDGVPENLNWCEAHYDLEWEDVTQ